MAKTDQCQAGTDAAAASPDYTVTALARGLRLLRVFSDQRRELRLSELAPLSSLPVPTAFRLLKTLEAEEYVEQLPDGRFRPAAAVLQLGYSALQGLDVIEAASSPLRGLAAKTGETVNLGVLVGVNVLYLHRIKNTDLVTATLQVGSVLPAACTSIGKLMLAFLPPPELERRLSQLEFPLGNGPNAAVSTEQLERDLVVVRSRGWALQDEEVAYGLRSVSAPVRDRDGRVIAGLNIAVQASRWTTDRLIEELLPPLLDAAAATSRWMGFVEPAERKRETGGQSTDDTA